MKSYYLISVFLLLLAAPGCDHTQSLFEEHGTDWYEEGQADWQFEDGEIIGRATGENGWLMTTDSFADFELTLEFFPDNTVNSGIFIRCADENLSMVTCYEINIWDNHPDQQSRTGAIVSRTRPLNHVETNGKWNTYRIRAKGGHIQAWVNGVQTADYTDESLPAGHIALQAAETGTIRFRNVRLQSLTQ